MVYTSVFSSSKCSLFHNSNIFGSYIIHILYTGCTKIKKKSGAKRLKTPIDISALCYQQGVFFRECSFACMLVSVAGLIILQTPWSGVLENLIIAQVVKIRSAYFLNQYSQMFAIGPYPEPYASCLLSLSVWYIIHSTFLSYFNMHWTMEVVFFNRVSACHWQMWINSTLPCVFDTRRYVLPTV
jgi:hypothetical protein